MLNKQKWLIHGKLLTTQLVKMIEADDFFDAISIYQRELSKAHCGSALMSNCEQMKILTTELMGSGGK